MEQTSFFSLNLHLNVAFSKNKYQIFKLIPADIIIKGLLQQLTAFEENDKEVANVASKKLASHLWYLSEELVALSLFDDSVPHDMRAKIVEKMREEELYNPPKRAVVDLKDI